jgi:hypothetical protein
MMRHTALPRSPGVHRRSVLALLPALLLAACGGGQSPADQRNRHGGPNGNYTFPATDYFQQAPGKPGACWK